MDLKEKSKLKRIQFHYITKYYIIVFRLARTKNTQTIALRWAEARRRRMFCHSAMFSLHFPSPCQWLQNKRICELNPIVLRRSAANFSYWSCSPSMWKNVLVMFVCFIFFLSFTLHCNLELHISDAVWTTWWVDSWTQMHIHTHAWFSQAIFAIRRDIKIIILPCSHSTYSELMMHGSRV